MGIENVIFDMGNVLLRFDGMLFSRIFTKDEDDARLLNEALFAHPSWSPHSWDQRAREASARGGPWHLPALKCRTAL